MSRVSLSKVAATVASASIPAVLLLGGAWVVSLFSAEPSVQRVVVPSVEFSKYLTGEQGYASAPLSLGAHRVLASVSADDKQLQDIAVTRDFVAVVASGKLWGINRRTGRVDVELGSHDTAAAALGSPASVQGIPGTNDVWVYSFSNGELTKLPLSRRGVVTAVTYLEHGLMDPTWVGEQILAGGGFSDGALHLYGAGTSPKGLSQWAIPERWAGWSVPRTSMELRGPTAPALFPRLSWNLAVQLNQMRLAFEPTRGKVVAASKFLNRVNIYSAADGRLERALAGPVESRLDFSVEEDDTGAPRFVLNSETMTHYLDVAASKDFIVALFAGRRWGVGGDRLSSDTLHVFDWDGAFVGSVALDTPVRKIAVDNDSATLYATGGQPNTNRVFAFQLRSLQPAAQVASR